MSRIRISPLLFIFTLAACQCGEMEELDGDINLDGGMDASELRIDSEGGTVDGNTADCGNGIVELGEVCDDGENTGTYNGCAQGCLQLGPRCGDSMLQATFGEICDDGINNGENGSCLECTSIASCGDGVVDDGEVCDDGINDGTHCSVGCQFIPPPVVLINEFMYHPVLEEDFDDNHEFVELFNPRTSAVDLSGWALSDGIDFTFPVGSEVAPEAFVVLAKNRSALLTEYPDLNPNLVLGDYEGRLGNGGDDIVLERADGTVSDAVDYNDDFPWPTAGDAMGANDDWLAQSLLPESDHQYRGYSLERVSSSSPSDTMENWVTSELDAPTPGAVNSADRMVPLAQVEDMQTFKDGTQNDPSELILSNDSVRIEVTFSRVVLNPSVERFIDDVNATGEATVLSELRDDGMTPDTTAGDLTYTAVIDADPERSIVRYRIRGDRGDGDDVIAPRANEPFPYFSYFISPDHAAVDTRSYEVFIGNNAFTNMWSNIENGRVNDCDIRESWNHKEAAVFVDEDGHVFDVRVRHQGSTFQRRNGTEMQWPFPGPTDPDPLKSLSWRVGFPRYDRFGGRKAVILNKLNQACAGFSAIVGFKMAELVDIPMPKRVRYARLFINGGYYNTVLEVDRMGELMMEAYEESTADLRGVAEAPLGHLFKSSGSSRQGPYVRSDGVPIPDDNFCGYDLATRYEYSYERKTHTFLDNSAIRTLIESGDTAYAQGPAALKAFVDANFDIERMLNFLAARQYHAPWDDDNHNWFIYQFAETGRWVMVPWDLDLTFGSTGFANGSRYYAPLTVGDEIHNGDSTVRSNVNRLKMYFMRSYYDEYITHLKALNETTFQPSELTPLLDNAHGRLNQADAMMSQTGLQCDVDARRDSMLQFFSDRHDFIRAWPPTDRTNHLIDASATASSGGNSVANSHDNTLHISNYFESADGDLTPSVLYQFPGNRTVSSVHVSTGIECCATEIDYNLLVEVLDAAQNVVASHPVVNPWNGFGAPTSNGMLPTYIEFELNTPVSARYIRVSKSGFAGSERLRLSEVRAH